jgi:hypothetical protein
VNPQLDNLWVVGRRSFNDRTNRERFQVMTRNNAALVQQQILWLYAQVKVHISFLGLRSSQSHCQTRRRVRESGTVEISGWICLNYLQLWSKPLPKLSRASIDLPPDKFGIRPPKSRSAFCARYLSWRGYYTHIPSTQCFTESAETCASRALSALTNRF